MSRWHYLLLFITTVIVCLSYLLGRFGGKEYFEFPPALGALIALYWLIFMFNYFRSIRKKMTRVPIYIWMWSTGLIFFIITFCEAYLWMLPFFRDNIIRDLTVQWKSMGSMVGAWNMMVYGTGFYVMEKISNNDKVTRSPVTYFFYFLSLTNLMFNWGHHIYIIPAAKWIGTVAFIISMTELLLLGSIILNWQKTLSEGKKHFHIIPYRFLFAADVWIFLNLLLAICISVPAINLYTHGTHITVAHSMGSTIGINTMILLASLYYIAERQPAHTLLPHRKKIKLAFWVTNISLFFFWIAMLGSGIGKISEAMIQTPFSIMMTKLTPCFNVFAISGVGIFIGVLSMAIALYNSILSKPPLIRRRHKLQQKEAVYQ